MLPIGKYVPPSQRGRSPSPPSSSSQGQQPLISPTGSSSSQPRMSSPVLVSLPSPPPQVAIQEQAPSPYADSYLQAEATRPKHVVPPLWPSTVPGTAFGSYKAVENRKGYVILRTRMLGKGSFGSVFRGVKTNPKTGKKDLYAIKVIQRSFQGGHGRKGQTDKALLNEINNWEHCNGNPFVVKLIDHYAVMQEYNFVMEFAGHGDLTGEIKKGKKGRLPDLEARYYFRQMVAGINYLHARGIAHRDIKCDNFLLCDSPKDPTLKIAKVIDFGLSTVCWTTYGGPMYDRNNCGTVRYMPPEVLLQRVGNPWPLRKILLRDLDETAPTARQPPEHPNWVSRRFGAQTLRPRSMIGNVRDFQNTAMIFPLNNDSWSLGVSLFVMTTGTYPFFTGDLPYGLDLIMKGKFIKYRYMAQATREFIRTMLEPDPAKRATTRNILYHDWMFLNTPSRKGRQSQGPDLSTYVPPPYPVVRGSSAAWSAGPAGGPIRGPVPVPPAAAVQTPQPPTAGSSALFPTTPPSLKHKQAGRAVATVHQPPPGSSSPPPQRGRAGAIAQPIFSSSGSSLQSPPPAGAAKFNLPGSSSSGSAPGSPPPQPAAGPQAAVIVPGDVAPSQSSGSQSGGGTSPMPGRAKSGGASAAGSRASSPQGAVGGGGGAVKFFAGAGSSSPSVSYHVSGSSPPPSGPGSAPPAAGGSGHPSRSPSPTSAAGAAGGASGSHKRSSSP